LRLLVLKSAKAKCNVAGFVKWQPKKINSPLTVKHSFFYFFSFVFLFISNALFAQKVLLPNGWYLSPAGSFVPLSSDLPLNMAFAPDGIHVAITNNGNGKPTIDLINLKEHKVEASKQVKNAWAWLFQKITFTPPVGTMILL